MQSYSFLKWLMKVVFTKINVDYPSFRKSHELFSFGDKILDFINDVEDKFEMNMPDYLVGLIFFQSFISKFQVEVFIRKVIAMCTHCTTFYYEHDQIYAVSLYCIYDRLACIYLLEYFKINREVLCNLHDYFLDRLRSMASETKEIERFSDSLSDGCCENCYVNSDCEDDSDSDSDSDSNE